MLKANALNSINEEAKEYHNHSNEDAQTSKNKTLVSNQSLTETRKKTIGFDALTAELKGDQSP